MLLQHLCARTRIPHCKLIDRKGVIGDCPGCRGRWRVPGTCLTYALRSRDTEALLWHFARGLPPIAHASNRRRCFRNLGPNPCRRHCSATRVLLCTPRVWPCPPRERRAQPPPQRQRPAITVNTATEAARRTDTPTVTNFLRCKRPVPPRRRARPSASLWNEIFGNPRTHNFNSKLHEVELHDLRNEGF